MANVHQPHDYVQADIQIDPSGEDLPAQHYWEATSKVTELWAIHDTELWCSKHLQKQQETRNLEAKLIEEANQLISDHTSQEASPPSVSEGLNPSFYGNNLTLVEALFEWTSNAMPTTWRSEEFTNKSKLDTKMISYLHLSWTNLQRPVVLQLLNILQEIAHSTIGYMVPLS
jgi:hypothetical protein